MRKLYPLLISLLFPIIQSAIAQERSVSGIIMDETEKPIPFATVAVRKTTIGTQSDATGKFTIAPVSDSSMLEVSYVGYETQALKVGGSSMLTISLRSSVKGLNEVVVTALGISRSEKSLGYSTQQVKGENLTVSNEQNVLGSLSGKIAGVQVIGSSGASLGGTAKIKIRGVNNINGNDQPLIVVDGTPLLNDNFGLEFGRDYGNIIQDLNPDDIGEVNVLKGPAATALYGIRGQYGVILINTKKGIGIANKTVVDFSTSLGIQNVFYYFPYQNIYGGGYDQTFANSAINGDPIINYNADESWGPKMEGQLVRQYYSWYPEDPDYGKMTPFLPQPNNIKEFYNTGVTNNNNISIHSVNNWGGYRLSFNHTTISGVTPGSSLKRNNVGFSGDFNIDKNGKLKAVTNLNYATNDGVGRPQQGYGLAYSFNQWFERQLDMKKLKHYVYPDGTYNTWNINSETDLTGLYWNNPYFEAYQNIAHDSRQRVWGNVGINYQITPWLNLSANARRDQYGQDIDQREASGSLNQPYFSYEKATGMENNYDYLLQFNHNFRSLSLVANFGGNITQDHFTNIYAKTTNGLSAPKLYNLDASIGRPTLNNADRKQEIRSLYGGVSVGYHDFIYAEANLRNDWSSTLPTNNNSLLYPSFSTSFIFSELLKWSPLSYGKIRLSYAQAGENLGTYLTSENAYGLGIVYNNSSPSEYLPDTLNNPNLLPTLANSYEAGLEMNWLHNRAGFDFTYYHQNDLHEAITVAVPSSSGYYNAVINAGSITNQGIELHLFGMPVRTKKVSWDVDFNVAHNNNKVNSLANNLTTLQLGSFFFTGLPAITVNAVAGESFGVLRGTGYVIDSSTGKMELDESGFPLIDPNKFLGNVNPDLTGGLTNTVSVGPFTLSVFLDYQLGGKFISLTKTFNEGSGLGPETVATNDKGKNVRDPVSEGGGIRIDGEDATTGQAETVYLEAFDYYHWIEVQHEPFVYDATFLKVREARLSYSLPISVISKAHMQKASVAVFTDNPWIIYTAVKGLDPSQNSEGNLGYSWLESGALPNVRTFGVDLNLSF